MERIENLEELFFNAEQFLVPVIDNYAVKGFPRNAHDPIYYKPYQREWYFRTYKEVIFGGLVWVRKIFNSPLNDLKLLQFEFGRKKQWFNIQIVKTGKSIVIDGEDHYPFINIAYSYNAVNSIKFEIGFYRFACQNGLVSGYKELGKLKITPENLFEIPFWVNPCLLLFLTNRYETQIKILKRTQFSYGEITKFIYKNFKNWGINDWKIEQYLSEMGSNAYGLLNILSDSASHPNEEQVEFKRIRNFVTEDSDTEFTIDSEKASRQRKVGDFLEKLSSAIEIANNGEYKLDINDPRFKLTSENIDLVESIIIKEKYHFDLSNWKY
jgi:hypothetical protein